MRSILLALFMIGCAHAAMQARSPVYSAKPGMNPAKAPEPAPALATQQAQAREGTAPADAAPGTGATAGAPDQHYVVYYYQQPNGQYRAGTPNAPVVQGYSEPGFFTRIPWVDVTYVVSSLVLLGVGGFAIYSAVTPQAKQRAMRELQNISYDDVSQMARRVYTAIEKYQNLQVENQ